MKHIHSRDNIFFKKLKRLSESSRERRKVGETLLDGLHLIIAYEALHGPVVSLLVAETALAGGEIADFMAERLDAGLASDITILADRLVQELGLVETPSGIVALIKTPMARAAVDLDRGAILLDGIQDPGNVGTLLRTAAAAGIRQALLGPGCAAAWSPKVLRAGQGAHFALDVHEAVDLAGFLRTFRGVSLATCLHESVPLYDAVWDGPPAWIFGAEGQGVRPELIEAAQLRVHIPMPGAVESLNVAAAAAICLFEAVRRQHAQASKMNERQAQLKSV